MGSCGSATKQDAVGQWAEKAGTIVASLSLSLSCRDKISQRISDQISDLRFFQVIKVFWLDFFPP